MIQPGRNYSAGGGYRYGFNGQEKSDEIFVNSTTALFWEYDSRLGRRWNIDPEGSDYESPYLGLNGNPINIFDLLGNKGSDHIYRKNGQEVGREIRTDKDNQGHYHIITELGSDAKLTTYPDGSIGIEGTQLSERRIYYKIQPEKAAPSSESSNNSSLNLKPIADAALYLLTTGC